MYGTALTAVESEDDIPAVRAAVEKVRHSVARPLPDASRFPTSAGCIPLPNVLVLYPCHGSLLPCSLMSSWSKGSATWQSGTRSCRIQPCPGSARSLASSRFRPCCSGRLLRLILAPSTWRCAAHS
eukprot:3802888-Prymnesium_polylepis.1